MNMTPKNVAYHEAGHAVAQEVFGFGSSYLTIVPNHEVGYAGECNQLEYWREGEDFNNYIISLIAGYAAECRFDPTLSAEAYDTAGHDFSIAKKELKRFGLPFDEAYWIAKATAFVETEWR